jgi:hypothetical protein
MTKNNNELKEYLNQLLDNDFKILISKTRQSFPKMTYAHFEKNNRIGYVQYDFFRGFIFSTVHKPNNKYGTGFVCQDYQDSISKPTIKNALNCLLYKSKFYDNNQELLYKNLEEFKKMETVLEYEFITSKFKINK